MLTIGEAVVGRSRILLLLLLSSFFGIGLDGSLIELALSSLLVSDGLSSLVLLGLIKLFLEFLLLGLDLLLGGGLSRLGLGNSNWSILGGVLLVNLILSLNNGSTKDSSLLLLSEFLGVGVSLSLDLCFLLLNSCLLGLLLSIGSSLVSLSGLGELIDILVKLLLLGLLVLVRIGNRRLLALLLESLFLLGSSLILLGLELILLSLDIGWKSGIGISLSILGLLISDLLCGSLLLLRRSWKFLSDLGLAISLSLFLLLVFSSSFVGLLVLSGLDIGSSLWLTFSHGETVVLFTLVLVVLLMMMLHVQVGHVLELHGLHNFGVGESTQQGSDS